MSGADRCDATGCVTINGSGSETSLPGREGTVGVTARENRLFVEAVLYRYRAGIPWRDLPERFGDGVQVQRRFSRWAIAGVWERVFQHLAGEADNEYAMIDSTMVRAHQHRAGAQKSWLDQAVGRSRGGLYQDPYAGRCPWQPAQVLA